MPMGGTEIGALSILVGLFVWYLKYQTKQQTKREDKQDTERIKRQDKLDEEQKKDREYFRNLLTNDVKELHKDNLKNAELNNQSIVLLKDIGGNQNKLCKLIESVDRRINGR